MIRQCQESGLPDPVWLSDKKLGVTVTFRAPEVTPEVMRLLERLDGLMLRRELQTVMDLKDDEHFRKSYIQPALEAGLIEMTIPDKPRSSKQQYRLTPLGIMVRGQSGQRS